jgi:regulator of replication initiation timing
MKKLVLLPMLVLCVSVWAREPNEPNELKKLRIEKAQLKQDYETMRQANIKLRKENQQLKEENKKLTSQLKALEPLKQQAEDAKSTKNFFSRHLSVGQIGKINDDYDAEVRKIIDANSAWIRLTFDYYDYSRREHKSETQLVFVRGIDTSTMADGLKLNLPGLFKITGTEKRGERTAFLLEPYNDK